MNTLYFTSNPQEPSQLTKTWTFTIKFKVKFPVYLEAALLRVCKRHREVFIIKNKLILAWRSLGSTRLLFAHFSLEEATALRFTDLQRQRCDWKEITWRIQHFHLFRVVRRCDRCIWSVLCRSLVIPTQVHVGWTPIVSIFKTCNSHVCLVFHTSFVF